MAGETPITVVGNLTADPELRFTPSGAAVANFTVASTPRTFDRQTNEWKVRGVDASEAGDRSPRGGEAQLGACRRR